MISVESETYFERLDGSGSWGISIIKDFEDFHKNPKFISVENTTVKENPNKIYVDNQHEISESKPNEANRFCAPGVTTVDVGFWRVKYKNTKNES